MTKSDQAWIDGYIAGYESAMDEAKLSKQLTKLRRNVWKLDHQIAVMQNNLLLVKEEL